MSGLTATRPTEHLLVMIGSDRADVKLVQGLLAQLTKNPSGHSLDTSATIDELKRSSLDHSANHALVVVSNSRETQREPSVVKAARWCLDNFIPVFFVCDTTDHDFGSQVPDILRPINGMPYDNLYQLTENVRQILHLIGYDERERSVFISYRRSDASGVASDLRHALLDRGWDVFLDRFSVPPGVDFQVQLDRDLDGRSLVLVIESPDINDSDWVAHEIAFAKAHGVGLQALRLPETLDHQIVADVDAGRRLTARYSRFEERFDAGGPPPGLIKIVETLQRTHTLSLRARRDSMLDHITSVLIRGGYKTEPIGEWAIGGVRHGARRVVVLATPRMPRPSDLRQAQQLRGQRRARSGCDAWVVHPLVDPDSEALRLLKWLRRDRPIRLCNSHELQLEIMS